MAINMTKEQTFEKSLPRAGKHLARLVEYIEVGDHVHPKFGAQKDSIILGFELLSSDDIYEHEGEKKAPIFRTFPFKASRFHKSGAMKVFRGLNYKQNKDITGFDQLIGESCIINIKHMEKKTPNKDGTKVQYAAFDFEHVAYAPVQHDVLTGDTQDIKVHPQINKSKVFDFHIPSTEVWNDLFIPGTYENGEAKNWIQDKIMSATNYLGSAVEKLLDSDPITVPDSTPAPAPSDIEDFTVPTSTSETPPVVENPLDYLK